MKGNLHNDKIDAVIVGAGPAGCLYAAKLAGAGKNVLVLEQGPARTTGDLISSHFWGRRLKWRGAPVLSEGKHPFPHNFSCGDGFGGSALHHFGTWPRFREDTFKQRTLYGEGLDWPIEYADLRPYYDTIQTEVGIAGDAKQEIWRAPGAPYPMLPHPRLEHGRILASGFEKLGKVVAPLPVIINSIEYKGRPACEYKGWCGVGCPLGALGNPLFTHFLDARKAGAEFRSDCTVTRILSSNKKKVSGVEYIEDGQTRIQHASIVIVAASFIQTPRLLLNSVSSFHPKGLANLSGMVGRHIAPDILTPVYGLFDQETECHVGPCAGQLMHRGVYDDPARSDVRGDIQWQIAPSMKPNDLLGVANTRVDLFGKPLTAFMSEASHRIGFMAGFGGVQPWEGNRIETASDKDAFGMPLARVIHSYPERALRMNEYLILEGKAVMKAAGAKEVWTVPPTGSHFIGGTIMGKDPKTSVANSFGRTHDLRNLVLAGAGLFPAGSGFSPTFTIYAVALRSAQDIIVNWREYAV